MDDNFRSQCSMKELGSIMTSVSSFEHAHHYFVIYSLGSWLQFSGLTRIKQELQI